ncbi:ATP-binding cassette domain-containing protein [Pseudooceanicola sp. 216_PA32_1]|uniref:ATP-binding cassette domain-containing protein n=1 Tax=Pseudooceanicola pacificus TaxID=2676438 RepID=A0A844W5L1_9RHOB|nr:ATP-binding cassette domain-containing protein [Pseudooceanicola pacificus]MWB79147.1 ATP-binding cassette domain-containing protein [Pseudooceanicola pacificus]
MSANTETPLLSVRGLNVYFGPFQALKNIGFDIPTGTTLGLVGESGSGKTTIGKVILGQVKAESGSVIYDGEDITNASRSRRRGLGRDIQVVFQDPYSSLNPTRTIGQTLSEPLMMAGVTSRTDIRRRIKELLDIVGMPADTADRYPFEFSGGQRQRVAVARAVIAKPRLVVCDEPVSALDLSVQAQVLNLLNDLQRELSVSFLFISHDLTVVRHVSHRTIVLYKGEIVEEGDGAQIQDAPQHAYTRTLLAAAPVPDPARQREKRQRWREMRQAQLNT